MALALALALTAFVFAQLWRWRAHDRLGLDALVIVPSVTITVVGVIASLLGLCGWLTPGAVALACAALALVWFPWRAPARTPAADAGGRWHWLLGAALVLGATALRWPPMPYELAGRDQGTYLLRAQWSAREGDHAMVDPIVRDAAADHDDDLLGLHPRRGEAWRDDIYEAGYRPGWYLADRERGLVVPQFLHLHPSAMAVSYWLAPALGPSLLVLVEGVLGVLALWAVSRRLWSNPALALLPALASSIAPLSTWVHRNTLTEPLTGLLTLVAVLAALRARDRGDDELTLTAFALGATAWVRGNAWITAAPMLAVLWLLPHGRTRHRATAVFLAMLAASVLAHASSVFPYLHDELARLPSGGASPSPMALVVATGIAIAIWWSVDELVFGPRGRLAASPWLPRLRGLCVPALALALVLALAAWAVRAGPPHPPWSRLDALVPALGPALLVPGGLGVVLTLWRWRWRDDDAATGWLLAILAMVVATVVLYGARSLPKFGLYYYGRYLVPELLPLACIGATALLARLLPHAGARVPALRGALAAGLAAMWLFAIAWPWLRAPQLRLREYAGAGRIVDALAERVPADALVIAGGEGWHHGHTFNQVAGALAVRHGRAVLPYYSREAAFASLYSLMVEAPARHGRAAPRVFLLLGEATHASTPERGDTAEAAIDDLLPPPFVALPAVGLELVTDRLTPRDDGLPTAVTRDSLRMALFEVVVAREDEVAHVRLDPDGRVVVDRGPAVPGLRAAPGEDARCLQPELPLELELPRVDFEVGAVVVRALPGTAGENEQWRVEIDGELRGTGLLATASRSRTTLGPFSVAHPPLRVRLWGAARARDDGPCRFGGVDEVMLLGREQSTALVQPPETIALLPPDDLGHAVTPVRWRFGRGLSRWRPGIAGGTPIRGVSLQVTRDVPVSFDVEPMDPRVNAVDLVISLSATALSGPATLELRADDVLVASVPAPASRERSWQSPRLRWRGDVSAVRWSVRLLAADDDDAVWLRDVALFAVDARP